MTDGAIIPNTALVLGAKMRTGEALPPSHVVLGSGSATPAEGSVGVQTEVIRKLANISRIGSEVCYEITIAEGELDASVSEMSLTNAATGLGDCDYLEVFAASPQICDSDHGAIFRIYRDRTRVS